MSASTPTTTARHGTDHAHTRPEPADLHRIGRINRRLLLLLATSILGIVIALTLLLVQDRTPTVSRADAASTASLDEAAAQYDAIRQTRSNQAATARLEAAAAHYRVTGTELAQ